ncbi:MAG: hypothetical protein J5605_03965 [Bacteroidales bacterium]|nr:hypothetical protein [Bacteroidales bacterium]
MATRKKNEKAQSEQTVVNDFVKQQEVDIAVEKRLLALYTLQCIDTQIDKIRIARGELPLEVQDLEDEIVGLETRISNFKSEISTGENAINEYKNSIDVHKATIEKYTKQQENVRNNREFESLNKEIEYQGLEIQLCERKIKEMKASIKEKHQHIEIAKNLLETRKGDLLVKKQELEEITREAEREEKVLTGKSQEQEKYIEERYLTAYKRIRNAARNGLAVVPVERAACGGCFSQIPFQRQMEIKMHRKIIVCEHCGRILVDTDIVNRAKEMLEKQ